MIVIYSYGTIYKKDADTGVFQCPNCGHITPHELTVFLYSIYLLLILGVKAAKRVNIADLYAH